MTDWNALIVAALINGALLSLVLTVIMIISGMVALDMWVGDYPPDVRARYGPMSDRARRVRPFFAVAFFAVTLLIPLWGLSNLRADLGPIPFLGALAFGALAVFVFNLYDLLILDWLFFCTIQPRAMVLPGTEGMAGYRDYRMHFMGFLKGMGFVLAGGLIIAIAWTLTQLLLR